VVVSTPGLLPWQGPALDDALQCLRTAGAVVHGQPGSGQLELALAVARAWLCEGHAPAAQSASGGVSGQVRACGQCASCHLFDQGYHPDFKAVLPEALQPQLGWEHLDDGGADDKGEGAKKRKPSADIKVDAIRQVVAFAQSSVSRGRAKVVLIHPADRMNTVSANTLLKTLEEPPGQVRFLLSCGALDDLLPTVRSRCQAWRLPAPAAADVRDWLRSESGGRLSDEDADLALAATGGSPQQALEWLRAGWSAAVWRQVLKDIDQGVAGAWAAWPLPWVIDTLQKLCHDLASLAAGGGARFFPGDALHPQARLERLTAWSQELRKARRHADHPWNQPLRVEALLQQARRAVQKG